MGKSRRNNMSIIVTLFMLVVSPIFISGCGIIQSNHDDYIKYLSNKYNDTFVFIEPTSGSLTTSNHEAFFKSEKYPNERILVGKYKGDNGDYFFRDNYIAVSLHDKAKEKIDIAINQVITSENHSLFFHIPLETLPVDINNLNDYLENNYNGISITVVIHTNNYDESENQFNRLIESFGNNKIKVRGSIVWSNKQVETGEHELNPLEYTAKESDHYKMVNFEIDNTGELLYSRWKNN